jgi:hypothetical protein
MFPNFGIALAVDVCRPGVAVLNTEINAGNAPQLPYVPSQAIRCLPADGAPADRMDGAFCNGADGRNRPDRMDGTDRMDGAFSNGADG